MNKNQDNQQINIIKNQDYKNQNNQQISISKNQDIQKINECSIISTQTKKFKKEIHDLDDDINYPNNKNEELTSIILTMQKQNIDANKKYFFPLSFYLFLLIYVKN